MELLNQPNQTQPQQVPSVHFRLLLGKTWSAGLHVRYVSQSCNGPFRRCRCHAKLRFLVLFIKTTIHIHKSIESLNITVCQGANGCPQAWHTFLLANLGSHISECLQRIFLKLHRLTKLGTIKIDSWGRIFVLIKSTRNRNFA